MRLVLCDDSGLFRAGLASLLRDLGLDVVGEADTTEGLLAVVDSTAPDAAIVDLRMPPTFSDEGLIAALTMRERNPEVGVLVLSTYVETTYAMRLLKGNVRGVGYLLKDRVDDAESLLTSIERVVAGETVIDPLVVTRLMERSQAELALSRLTPRERDVLTLVAEGRTNAFIAASLFLSTKTVETHVAALFNKFDIISAPDSSRRVLAVLTYLRASGQAPSAF